MRSIDGIAASSETTETTGTKTAWGTVLLAICAGFFAAFQVGKVHIALLSIRQSFSLDLVSASWILSALNVVGLIAAVPIGTLSAHWGNRRSVIAGLMIIAGASAGGGCASSLWMLLVTRLLEGVGFVVVVVAVPSLIIDVTNIADIRIALAGWSTYMPGGIALISFIAPTLLVEHSWRSVWLLNGILPLVLAVLMLALGQGARPQSRPSAELRAWPQFTRVASTRGPLLLALIFGMYTLQHLSIMGFMPTLLRERFHVSEQTTGILVAVAMASNIIGNLAAGILLQRGVLRSRIIVFTSIFMACVTVAMFVFALPLPAFYLCAMGFSGVGGLVPSAVMGAAPFHAPDPFLIGATNGLLVQGSNLGIVFGPPIVSSIATHFGWAWVPAATGGAAIMAAIFALNLQVPAHSRTCTTPSNAIN
jgi:MFS family permease